MKRIVCIVSLVVVSLVVYSQAVAAPPPLINYQGKLTDENGVGITDIKKLEFNIYDAATGGTPVWGPQKFEIVPVIEGLFNVILGTTDTNGRSISVAFNDPGNFKRRYLGIKVTNAGGDLTGVPELVPRQQILSAPYALSAMELNTREYPDGDGGRIYFDPSTNNDMIFQTYNDNNEDFIFQTTNSAGTRTERARINEEGLLVIGDKIRLTARDSSHYLTLRASNSAGLKIESYQDPLWINHDSKQNIYLMGDRVGIGTTSPAAELGVNGAVSAEHIFANRCRICLAWADQNRDYYDNITCVYMRSAYELSDPLELGGDVGADDKLWLLFSCY